MYTCSNKCVCAIAINEKVMNLKERGEKYIRGFREGQKERRNVIIIYIL